MGIIIECMEYPKNCFDCPFLSKPSELYLKQNLYKKIACCSFAAQLSKEDDFFRDYSWFSEHKEEWCPIKEEK